MGIMEIIGWEISCDRCSNSEVVNEKKLPPGWEFGVNDWESYCPKCSDVIMREKTGVYMVIKEENNTMEVEYIDGIDFLYLTIEEPDFKQRLSKEDAIRLRNFLDIFIYRDR